MVNFDDLGKNSYLVISCFWDFSDVRPALWKSPEIGALKKGSL